VDGRDQLLGAGALEQEAGGPRAEGPEDVVVLLEGREDDDPGLGRRLEHGPGRLDPIDARHPDIHQHDVRTQPPGRGGRLGAVAGLARHLDGRVAGEHGAQPGPHEVVVVDDQHSDARAHGGPGE
jgi:hypothetical protein